MHNNAMRVCSDECIFVQMTFGQVLRRRREELEFSREELAALTKISERTLAYYEKDERSPDLDALIRIADALGTSASELLSESEDRDELAATYELENSVNPHAILPEESSKGIWDKLGERIRSLRNAMGLSPDALASKSELSLDVVSDYEKGRRQPEASVLLKIAEALDTTGAYLLGEVDTPHKTFIAQSSGPVSREDVAALQEELKLVVRERELIKIESELRRKIRESGAEGK